MALRFYGRDPGNPEGLCPAMFREALTGDFFVQGKTVLDPVKLAEFAPLADDEMIVRLPGRMIDIVRSSCHDADLASPPGDADGGIPAVVRDPLTGDFYIRGKTVLDPAKLAEIDADSPILDDETIVWLPASMTATFRKACGDEDLVR